LRSGTNTIRAEEVRSRPAQKRGACMFNDLETIIGGVIGLLIVVVGTTIAVREHIRRSRNEE